MDLNAGIVGHVGRLVHPAAHASPTTHARHRFFIETRLAIGFAALGLLPLLLTSGGVPNGLDAALLACLMLPFVAVAVVSAQGRLFEAELISAAAWLLLAGTLAVGHLAPPQAAAALLVLLPLEASFGDSATKLRASAGLALAGGVLAALFAGGSATPIASWILLLGLCHGVSLCLRGAALRRETADLDRARARTVATVEDAISDLVVRFDGVAATVINPGTAAAQLGLAADDLAERGFFDRVHLADRPIFLQLMSDAGSIVGGHTVRLRLRTSPLGGSPDVEPTYRTVDLQLGKHSIGRPDEDRARFATIVQIRSASEAWAAPVADARPVVDEAWRDRLLANISHELRTPLNAIIGFSEILSSDVHLPKRAETRREYAEIIHASGEHLLAIVNSMLDLSKIDAGKFELTHEPFDVAELLTSCCDMVRLKAEQARIDLSCAVEPRALQITADKRACRQIVLNLLSNAIKFTPEYGRVAVDAQLDGDWLELVIADTGIGMLAQDLARIGDRFFQAQNATTRRFEGTGLGLSLVSGLVGLHGGTMTAESAPGEGTRMRIRLPREALDAAAPNPITRIETVSLPSRSNVVREIPHPKVKKIA